MQIFPDRMQFHVYFKYHALAYVSLRMRHNPQLMRARMGFIVCIMEISDMSETVSVIESPSHLCEQISWRQDLQTRFCRQPDI